VPGEQPPVTPEAREKPALPLPAKRKAGGPLVLAGLALGGLYLLSRAQPAAAAVTTPGGSTGPLAADATEASTLAQSLLAGLGFPAALMPRATPNTVATGARTTTLAGAQQAVSAAGAAKQAYSLGKEAYTSVGGGVSAVVTELPTTTLPSVAFPGETMESISAPEVLSGGPYEAPVNIVAPEDIPGTQALSDLPIPPTQPLDSAAQATIDAAQAATQAPTTPITEAALKEVAAALMPSTAPVVSAELAPIAAGAPGYGIGEEALAGIVQAAPTVASVVPEATSEIVAAEMAAEYGVVGGETAAAGVTTAVVPLAGIMLGASAILAPIMAIVMNLLTRETDKQRQARYAALAQNTLAQYGSAAGAWQAVKNTTPNMAYYAPTDTWYDQGDSPGHPAYDAARAFLVIRTLEHQGFITPSGGISTGGDLYGQVIDLNFYGGPSEYNEAAARTWINYLRSVDHAPTWDELMAFYMTIPAPEPASWSQSDSR
jgi:hypothetical protein